VSARRGGPRLSPAQIAAFLIEATIDRTTVGYTEYGGTAMYGDSEVALTELGGRP